MCEWRLCEPAPGITLRLIAGPAAIRAIELEPGTDPPGTRNDDHPLLREAAAQLTAYFAGGLARFELPLDLRGTDFQVRVWQELERIPYAETRSYRAIATSIGAPRSVRAVGAANGRNPIPIVVPCHRVIGADGRLVGYGGGLPLKKRLLDLESQYAARFGEVSAS
jgi:methylated-DNA-[protein]-cysteine S-methyltransferase